jgi:hypothetical protein
MPTCPQMALLHGIKASCMRAMAGVRCQRPPHRARAGVPEQGDGGRSPVLHVMDLHLVPACAGPSNESSTMFGRGARGLGSRHVGGAATSVTTTGVTKLRQRAQLAAGWALTGVQGGWPGNVGAVVDEQLTVDVHAHRVVHSDCSACPPASAVTQCIGCRLLAAAALHTRPQHASSARCQPAGGTRLAGQGARRNAATLGRRSARALLQGRRGDSPPLT